MPIVKCGKYAINNYGFNAHSDTLSHDMGVRIFMIL